MFVVIRIRKFLINKTNYSLLLLILLREFFYSNINSLYKFHTLFIQILFSVLFSEIITVI
jgi:hypothetical protein